VLIFLINFAIDQLNFFKMHKKFILFFILLPFSFSIAFAGANRTTVRGRYTSSEIQGKPKIFIEGVRLDMDYLRRNMRFVDFVNDPAVSDIHIIINSQTSGSGGRVYSIRFISRTFENFSEYTITATTASSDTEEESRKKITDALILGVMPFINESGESGKLSIRYQSDGDEETKNVETVDPWNHWTFRGDFNGGINAEERRKNYDYSINLRADQVTEKWKLRNSAFVSVRTTKIKNDDKLYTSERVSNNFSSSVIRSLTERWSTGTFINYSRNNYTNFQYSVSAKPAIEYNIFPWDISDRKVFTMAYYIGPIWSKYYEETLYGKFDEFLWQQTIRLDLQLVETWGEINAELRASNYLHDFSKNNISLDTRLSIRIVRGISVNFRFNIEKIQDQIYLPKGEASLEDVLLNNVQLPSSFEIGADVGLRIQFGSIYNNIVNNRL
jgi:hypothetical protein